VLEDVFSDLEREKAPVAIVVRKDTFSNHESHRKVRQRTTFKREAALRMVLSLQARGHSDRDNARRPGKSSRPRRRR
jgi:hypothetical protein